MIVTYQFHNDSMNVEKIWFWSKSIVNFLFSMDTLQKLSFFLTKGEDKYKQQVHVSLNATECWKVSDEYMTLLTQRVSHILKLPAHIYMTLHVQYLHT